DKLKLADASRILLVNAEQPGFLTRTAAHPQRELFGDAEGWHIAVDPSCPSLPRKNVSPGSDPGREPSAFSLREAESRSSRVRVRDVEAESCVCRGPDRIIEASILPMAGRHNV